MTKLINAKPLPTLVRSFIDTNVLIYAEARDEPIKQKIALELLKTLHHSNLGVLSTQVLQEYCNAGLKKLGLKNAYLRSQLTLLKKFEVVQVTPDLIEQGLALPQSHKFSFYDSIIIAAAQTSGCSVLYSEDLHPSKIGGVQIVNPFI